MRIRVTTRADLFEQRKQQHIERGYRIEDERPIPVNGFCSFIAVKRNTSFRWNWHSCRRGAQWDGEMRPHGKTKLGFFPLPVPEAARLKNCLVFASEFSALDPCVGDGVAVTHLLHGVTAHRYGIEIDANRAEQARALGIETVQANAMDVRCPAEAVSLLYLNPPYDWESGESNNQRLELVFLEHSYRWLKAGGVLLFIIPQLRLAKCARLLSEHFTDLRVFRLTEPACLEYKQIVVLGTRRKRHSKVSDAALVGWSALPRSAGNEERA